MGLWLAKPVSAQAPTIQQDEYQYISDDLIIKDNAIQLPPSGAINQSTSNGKSANRVETGKYATQTKSGIQNGHPTRSEKQISAERLGNYLSSKNSPLAGYAQQIALSPFASTIIGICTIEQYGCTKAPFFNYWGLGPGIRFKTIPEGIEAIDAFMAKAERNGRTTIESFRGWYCASECTSWESTVLKTKALIENLQ